MNPSQIDMYLAAFTSSNPSQDDEDLYTGVFIQIIMRKIQASLEQKLLNKSLGLNEDGTSSKPTTNTDNSKRGGFDGKSKANNLTTDHDSDNDSDWGLEDPEVKYKTKAITMDRMSLKT